MVAFEEPSTIIEPAEIVHEAVWLAYNMSNTLMGNPKDEGITKQQVVDTIETFKEDHGTVYISAVPFSVPVFLHFLVFPNKSIGYLPKENESANPFNALRGWTHALPDEEQLLHLAFTTCLMMQGAPEIDCTKVKEYARKYPPLFEGGTVAIQAPVVMECREHKMPAYKMLADHFRNERASLSDSDYAMKLHAIEYGGEVTTRFELPEDSGAVRIVTNEERDTTVFLLETE